MGRVVGDILAFGSSLGFNPVMTAVLFVYCSYLDLDSNLLSGSVPSTLGNLTALQ
jgi:hypothetical protein